MKKLIAALIAAIMAVSLAVTVSASPFNLQRVTDRPAFDPPIPYGTIVQVQGNQPNRDLIGGWTNITTNAQVMDLIHGFAGTMYVAPTGMIYHNPMVVRNINPDGTLQDIRTNPDGSQTFTIQLFDDWMYNDGTPVTAQHFVGGMLLTNSPEWGRLDATNTGRNQLVGWREYQQGETLVFEGIRLYDDYTFSVTVAPQFAGGFWTFIQADVGPSAIQVMMPGVVVRDNGYGAFLDFAAIGGHENFFDLIHGTVLGENMDGYRFYPWVTVGPYQLVVANPPDYFVLERNMNFRGLWCGTFPMIETIVQRWISSAAITAAFAAGEGDMWNAVTGLADIQTIMPLADAGQFNALAYDRPGFAYFGFHVDTGAARYRSARQATAWVMDRDEFNRQFIGGFGATINSMYATAFAIYQDNREWFEDNLIHYTFNPAMAVEVLVADGWVYDADGNPFVEGVSLLNGPRHKWSYMELCRTCGRGGEPFLQPLEIMFLGNDGGIAEYLEPILVPEAAAIGMYVRVEIVEFAEQIRHFNRTTPDIWNDPTWNAFALATSWTSALVAYWNMFNPDNFGPGNRWFVDDPVLFAYAQAMQFAQNREDFDQAWLYLLRHLNYELIEIPLYANIWFNFYRPDIGLQNYTPDTFWAFPHAIMRAYFD